MNIVFRPKFLEDLTREELWLMEHASVEVADRWHESLGATVDFLAAQPHMGRERRDVIFPGLRSWGVQNFRRWIIFYGVRQDGGLVLFRVVSGTMNLYALAFD